MANLFLCSVGPVQEFIATARRSRDLWFGSWMLSELSKAAALALQEIDGTQLIFPAPVAASELDPGSSLGVANKIMAIVEISSLEAAKIVYDRVIDRLHSLRDAAYQNINSSHFHRDIATKQVDDLVEYYWVSVPYRPNQYSTCRNQAEALLAARKNTRDFKQFEGEMVPKSSLDASRESVIDEKAYPDNRQDSAETQKEKIALLFRQFGAKRGERLSGVDLLKRLGSKGISFPSTSELAAAPFLKGLGEGGEALLTALYGEVSKYFPEFNDNNCILLYPGRAAEFLTDDQVDVFTGELEACLDEHAGGKSPGAYYALLVADGDGMGETLDALADRDAHQKFSQSLSRFADKAKSTIKENDGTPIYVGGDDIMAYLPLHTALACTADLEAAFRDDPEIPSTLSGGLVIAHHLQPLSEVLQLARAAEQEAKQVPGKNALCIVLNKRSGAERRITARWDELLKRLEIMAGWHCQKLISKGTAYELQKMSQTLKGTELPEADQKYALMQEAIRIIKRKKTSGGERDLPEGVRKQFAVWLENDKLPVEDLASEMIVAAVFAAAENLADMSLEPLEDADKEATP